MEYSVGLTSKLFWLQESRKTAGYILEGLNKADIQNGFKALIYMHRYDADTVGHVRTDYLHRA